jgi:phosphoribosylaminoimidazole synthetase
MPGMYSADDFDLAGFAVGAVERDDMLPKMENIEDGDVIIGLPSSGVHSNGYSMVRKVLEISGTSLDQSTPFDPSLTFGQVLLTPTRLYVKTLLPVIRDHRANVAALCHITGGGLVENIPRILPEDKCAELDANNWNAHPIFDWMHQVRVG